MKKDLLVKWLLICICNLYYGGIGYHEIRISFGIKAWTAAKVIVVHSIHNDFDKNSGLGVVPTTMAS